ncbi:hypothetical protein Nmel_001987, partial [Mimus melanotis]
MASAARPCLPTSAPSPARPRVIDSCHGNRLAPAAILKRKRRDAKKVRSEGPAGDARPGLRRRRRCGKRSRFVRKKGGREGGA